jgi:hypothetical protein
MGPFDLVEHLGVTGSYVVYLAIGFGFGFILESTGFADGRNVASQFYFREHRVLKTMFTAIVVAMVLIFWATALGWLDYDEIWVTHTYWWPGILGGLIMGAGMVMGGYCPGTSLASTATLKLDGAFFLLGVVVGVVTFGETVSLINDFWHAGSMGRFTLPEFLNMDLGWVVVLCVSLALAMFWTFDKIRASIYGKGQ